MNYMDSYDEGLYDDEICPDCLCADCICEEYDDFEEEEEWW